MKTNGFLAVLVVSLGLLAYVERTVRPSDIQVSKQEGQKEPLLIVRPQEIIGIRIQDSRGCIVVRKEGPTLAAVDELLAILVQMRIVRRVQDPLSDVASYGLSQPAIRITLLRQDWTAAQGLSIGDSNPTGSAVYAFVEGSPEVLLVGSYFLRAVDMVLSRVRESMGSSDGLACRP